jgi:NTE family protein
MKKVGLALGGGSARGLAHIGLLQVLEQEEIPIDLVVGTSIGSLVGAIYAAGTNLDYLAEIARQLNWKQILDPSFSRMGLCRGDKLQQLVRVLAGRKSFRQLRLPFAAIACDLKSGREVILREGEVARAVRASCSLPGVFKPVPWDEQLLVDGGVCGRLPVAAARKLGAQFVLAVDVGGWPKHDTMSNVFDILSQTFHIFESRLAVEQGSEADFLITPEVGHIGPERLDLADQLIAAGKEAAQAALPELQKLLGR